MQPSLYSNGDDMNTETGELLKTCLDGECSMRTVAEKYPALVTCLARLLDSGASGGENECSSSGDQLVDLAGVTDIDACGCQLLALFLCALRQNNVSAQLTNIPDTIRSKIHFLGFDSEFNLSH